MRLAANTRKVLKHPVAFGLHVLKAFRANQGLLLAGAVAYYTLLSLVPLLILVMIVLSHIIDAERLLVTLSAYLEFVVPGRSGALVDELRTFLDHRHVVGPVLLLTLLFFSALAFTVLEKAMSVIFYHRVAVKRRRFVSSAVMPYVFILFLGIGDVSKIFLISLILVFQVLVIARDTYFDEVEKHHELLGRLLERYQRDGFLTMGELRIA